MTSIADKSNGQEPMTWENAVHAEIQELHGQCDKIEKAIAALDAHLNVKRVRTRRSTWWSVQRLRDRGFLTKPDAAPRLAAPE